MSTVHPDPVPTLDRLAADAALAEAEEAVAGASASLVALEEHPGYTLLLPGGLSGVSARRRTETLATVAELHRDLALYRGAVARARAARGTSRRPGVEELATVAHQLLGTSVLLSEEEIPLQVRGLLGPSRTERRTSAPALLARMTAAFDAVSGVVAAVAQVWDDVVAQLAPLERGLAELPRDDGPDTDAGAEVAALRDAVDALRRDTLADPLARAGSRAPVPAHAVDALAHRLAAVRAAAVGRAQLRAGLPDRIAAARAALDALAAAEDATASAVAAAARDVVVTAAATPPRAPELRAALARAVGRAEAGHWDEAREAFAALDAHSVEAAGVAARERELFVGLVDRRAELRGRLRAFREKAVRRGRAEELALDALHTAAHDLLRGAPCDLAAATVAVRRYQRALETGGPGDAAATGVRP